MYGNGSVPVLIVVFTRSLRYQSNRSFNIPPDNPPGIWIFGKFLSKSPLLEPKTAVQMPPPPGKLPDNCFITFQLFLLCLWSCVCKHGLLDNTLTCHEMGIFHINTPSQTSWSIYEIIQKSSMNSLLLHEWWPNWVHRRFYVYCFMQQHLNTFHTFILLFIYLHMHRRKMYSNIKKIHRVGQSNWSL